MLKVSIHEDSGIALLEPRGGLSRADVDAAGSEINSYLNTQSRLDGLIIHTESFPGWQSFAAFCSYLLFNGDHHKKIKKIAIVTDSSTGTLGDSLASHFIRSRIRYFPYSSLGDALIWTSTPTVQTNGAHRPDISI